MSARLLKDPATANCRIFVGHLQTDDTNKVELEQHFSKYGLVIGSLINRGFGFVQFESEKAAQAAIQNENGQMFKGRRIDVKPAKKDTHNSGNMSIGNQSTEDKSKTKGGNQFSPKSNLYSPKNSLFGNSNNNQNFPKKNFMGGNLKSNSDDFKEHSKSDNDNYESLDLNDMSTSQHENNFEAFSTSDNSFSNRNSNKDIEKEQLNSGHSNKSNNEESDNNIDRENNSNTNSSMNINNHNNSNNDDNSNNTNNSNNDNDNNSGGMSSNQNRQNNQNRNHNNSGGQNFNQTSGNNGAPRQRGNRGGKNRNKNRGDNSLNTSNFRDRSPLNRGGMRGGNEEQNRDWDHNNVMMRNSNFNRDSFNDNRFDDRFKDVMPGSNYNYNRGGSFNGNRFDERFKDHVNTGNYSRGPSDYTSPPVGDKNDCEIIVVNKNLTEYAEAIEARLKKMFLTVDLLFPNEEVPLSRVLGNIANRGCLYALVIAPVNMEHYSITLNILHGLPQEHRNMPVEDALNLIKRDFSNYKSGGRSVPFNSPFASDRHPDAIQVLLNMLADNHQLTVLQYDRLMKYLEIKREEQVQTELGDTKDLTPSNTLTAVNDPKQAELQSRILNILNSNKTSTTNVQAPSPVPAPAPVPAPPAKWETGSSSTTTTTSIITNTTGVSPSPLLNDPTVQKALDSLLQGNLLKNIGESQSTPVPQPLFAAFPNIDRF